MIIPDVNMLIYAYDADASEHVMAKRWLDGLLDGPESVGLPWAVIIGFVRVLTNPSAMTKPVSTRDAVGYVREWLNFPHISILSPGPNHLDYVENNLDEAGAGGNLVSDSHIAAIAMEHGAVVHTNDRDFARFPGLLWHNPL